MFLLMFIVSGAALGGPLNKTHVRADAKWMFHADFDALRSSEIGKLILNDMQTKYQEKITAIEQLWGSDPTQDLHAVTLYGAQVGEENASALFYGNYNKEKLQALLILNKAYSKSEYEGKTLHHWVDGKNKNEQYGTFAADDLIIIGQTQASVTAALDVLSGKVGSLAQDKSSVIGSLCEGKSGSIAIAAADGLSELAKNDERAAILINSRLLAIVAAEEAGNMKLDMHLETDTEEAAMQIEQMARGMLALGMLQNQQYPQLGQLLQSVELTRTANTLDCKFKYPSAELFTIIKAEAEKKIN